ncbi:MAG: HvfC/BufC family peptide modification chaperone [Sulfuriferula sp.]
MKIPALSTLQNAFADFLQHGVGEDWLSTQISTQNIDPIVRLDVYRQAYYIRLEAALAHDFPTLRACVGDQAFGRLMAGYLQAHPSTSPTLRNLGRALPYWLRRQGMSAQADLASIEWAVLDAFDAAEASQLNLAVLAQIPPERWLDLRVQLQASVTLLAHNSNATAFWQAMHAGAPLFILDEGVQNWLAIARGGDGVSLNPLSEAQYAVLSRLSQGETVAAVCQGIADVIAPSAVSNLVAETIARAVASGWVCAMESR